MFEKLSSTIPCADKNEEIEFDELQTIEHTKLKQLSVAMAVTRESRKIVGFQVSQMPTTGHLAKHHLEKYGDRKDFRQKGLYRLFKNIGQHVNKDTKFRSDQCPYYESILKKVFPDAVYEQFKGARGSVYGQGELKRLI